MHRLGFRLLGKLESQKQRSVVYKIQLAQLDAEQCFFYWQGGCKIKSSVNEALLK